MLAPLLQEIGIPAGKFHDVRKGVFIDLHSLIVCGLGDGNASRIRRERTHFGKIEHPFGVGLGAAHLAAELGQAGADQRDRNKALGHPVHRCDEGGQFLFTDVLKLVYEQYQSRSSLLGGVASGFE